jgi:hypothetical protein
MTNPVTAVPGARGQVTPPGYAEIMVDVSFERNDADIRVVSTAAFGEDRRKGMGQIAPRARRRVKSEPTGRQAT